MAKYTQKKENGPFNREKVYYGILVAALGCLWLASELRIIQTAIPIGPVAMIVVGLVMILPHLKN